MTTSLRQEGEKSVSQQVERSFTSSCRLENCRRSASSYMLTIDVQVNLTCDPVESTNRKSAPTVFLLVNFERSKYV